MKSNLDVVPGGQSSSLVLRDLMDAFGKEVWRYAYSLTKRSYVADDISQEVFLAAYKGLASFRGDGSIKNWLLLITKNKVLDYRRNAYNRKVIPTVQWTCWGASPAAEKVVMERINNQMLWMEVMGLPSKYREILILTYRHGMNQKEISALLRIPEATIRTRAHRAKKRMSELLARKEMDFLG